MTFELVAVDDAATRDAARDLIGEYLRWIASVAAASPDRLGVLSGKLTPQLPIARVQPEWRDREGKGWSVGSDSLTGSSAAATKKP